MPKTILELKDDLREFAAHYYYKFLSARDPLDRASCRLCAYKAELCILVLNEETEGPAFGDLVERIAELSVKCGQLEVGEENNGR